MIVEATGPKGGALHPHLKYRIEHAVLDYAKQLKIDRLKTWITIRVHNVAVFPDNTEGLCESINNREFVIDLALYSSWMSTLAHEMVHVKQFARNELNPNMSTWKKKRVIVDDIPYYERPWEKEAFDLQYEMLKKYEKHPV